VDVDSSRDKVKERASRVKRREERMVGVAIPRGDLFQQARKMRQF
jgi:hypothetical protein